MVEPAVQAPAPARTYLVFFDWDRADLTGRAREIIGEAAQNARRAAVTRIEVAGHADRSGTPAYNQRLSQRRADAVAGEARRPRHRPQRDRGQRLWREPSAGADRRRRARAAEPPGRDRPALNRRPTGAWRSREGRREAPLLRSAPSVARVAFRPGSYSHPSLHHASGSNSANIHLVNTASRAKTRRSGIFCDTWLHVPYMTRSGVAIWPQQPAAAVVRGLLAQPWGHLVPRICSTSAAFRRAEHRRPGPHGGCGQNATALGLAAGPTNLRPRISLGA
ncbi:OmpA family protein [Dankookia sp. P2]|uniref:OmpA family protein n=1 Tax=Dankookia sp. P2 TaxID=3423955 RepID=UPI003D67DB0B